MRWTARSHPALVAAILASFNDSDQDARPHFEAFTQRDWRATEFWLDTSGLALYFFDRVKAAGLKDSIDVRTMQRLEQKRAANAQRMADLWSEFVAINRLFAGSHIRYANLKGFTLYPHSCADFAARTLSDLDFLVAPGDLSICRALLETRGYVLTANTQRTWEFRTLQTGRISVSGQYRAGQPRAVELHVFLDCPEPDLTDATAPDSRLNRLAEWKWKGERFPALSPADQLVAQALHLLGHLRNEHTRPSWLLEFRRHVRFRRRDSAFWSEVGSIAGQSTSVAIALGLSIMLARDLFGTFSSELESWTVDALPRQVSDWAKQYGRRSVLADVPGTKLYLLLDSALAACTQISNGAHRTRRLLPLRLPARIVPLPKRGTLPQWVASNIAQLRFLVYRAHFHIRQGLVYAIEARRWSRRCRANNEDRVDSATQRAWSIHRPPVRRRIPSISADTK